MNERHWEKKVTQKKKIRKKMIRNERETHHIITTFF